MVLDWFGVMSKPIQSRLNAFALLRRRPPCRFGFVGTPHTLNPKHYEYLGALTRLSSVAHSSIYQGQQHRALQRRPDEGVVGAAGVEGAGGQCVPHLGVDDAEGGGPPDPQGGGGEVEDVCGADGERVEDTVER